MSDGGRWCLGRELLWVLCRVQTIEVFHLKNFLLFFFNLINLSIATAEWRMVSDLSSGFSWMLHVCTDGGHWIASLERCYILLMQAETWLQRPDWHNKISGSFCCDITSVMAVLPGSPKKLRRKVESKTDYRFLEMGCIEVLLSDTGLKCCHGNLAL